MNESVSKLEHVCRCVLPSYHDVVVPFKLMIHILSNLGTQRLPSNFFVSLHDDDMTCIKQLSSTNPSVLYQVVHRVTHVRLDKHHKFFYTHVLQHIQPSRLISLVLHQDRFITLSQAKKYSNLTDLILPKNRLVTNHINRFLSLTTCVLFTPGSRKHKRHTIHSSAS